MPGLTGHLNVFSLARAVFRWRERFPLARRSFCRFAPDLAWRILLYDFASGCCLFFLRAESFTGRDIKAIGNAGGEGSAMIALVVAATGLGENSVLNMDARDVREIGAIAKPFLAGGEA